MSYIVDSTALPAATIIPFNVWPIYVAGLVTGSVPLLATTGDAIAFFFRALPFNFYAIAAVLGMSRRMLIIAAATLAS